MKRRTHDNTLAADFGPGPLDFSRPACRPAAKSEDLSRVRIKKFPIAMQCYTYRKYTFLEAVEKTKSLGHQVSPGLSRPALFAPGKGPQGRPQHDHRPGRESQEDGGRCRAGSRELRRRRHRAHRGGDAARSSTSPAGWASGRSRPSPRTRIIRPRAAGQGIRHQDRHPQPSRALEIRQTRDRPRAPQELDERIGAGADTGHWMRGGLRPAGRPEAPQGPDHRRPHQGPERLRHRQGCG